MEGELLKMKIQYETEEGLLSGTRGLCHGMFIG